MGPRADAAVAIRLTGWLDPKAHIAAAIEHSRGHTKLPAGDVAPLSRVAHAVASAPAARDGVGNQDRHLVLSRRGGGVARHGSGDVSVPWAKPLCCRLVRDAVSDLLRQRVARMGPNPVGRLRVRVDEEM